MPLTVRLNYDLGLPIFRQIFDAVAAALARGELDPDEQLPTIHALARELDVNPNTVIRAYQELEHAGLIVGERGRGTFPARRAEPRADKDQTIRKILRKLFREAQRKGVGEAELMLFLRKEFR